jgi:hypothetical protein
MMPTNFDKFLAPFLRPRDIPPGEPETTRLGRLEQVRPARHVAEALPFLGMLLEEFGRHGSPLELSVPWLDVTLWVVPGEPDVAALMAEGVSRGRIWTAFELMSLLQITESSPGTIETLARAKIVLDGDITEVRQVRPRLATENERHG